MLEKFKQKYSFSQTPALLVFEKGKCVSSVEWGKRWFASGKIVELAQNE